MGNSFSGASNRWVQNFFIHTGVQPDGTVNTWSHWDEGGRKFGAYRDGEIVGNTNVTPNSLEVRDTRGRLWKLDVEYTDPRHQEWEFRPPLLLAGRGAPLGAARRVLLRRRDRRPRG